jgi:hypothetical protein
MFASLRVDIAARLLRKKRHITRGLLALAAVGSLVPEAWAQTDATLGGDARSFAMGGAGIAIMQPQIGIRPNPATLAFETNPTQFYVPSFALRSSNGISLGSAYQFLFGGHKFDDLIGMTLDSFTGDGDFGANSGVSLRVGSFELSGFAVGRGRIQPNPAFVSWATENRNQPPPANVRSDGLATGYYTLPALSGSFIIPQRSKDKSKSRFNIAVGGRLKYMQAAYLHYIVGQQALTGKGEVQLASEMNGQTTLTRKGIGLDLGILLQPKQEDRNLSAALVIANLIHPNFKFVGTDRNDQPKEYNILKTTASAGAGYRIGKTILVGDITDITQSAGKTQLRMGVEHEIFPFITLRGGMNSGTGLSWGFGVFGFDAAFGKRQALEIVRTINF